MNVETKPMFGARGVYVGGKIVFIMRDRASSVEDNGVWLATTPEHHESLRRDFPSMRSIAVFGPGVTGWQVLPLDSEDFEDAVLRACRFVRSGDPRIGKIPAARRMAKKALASPLKKSTSPLKKSTAPAKKRSGVRSGKKSPPKNKR